ncbi:MAG: hypothetical protein DRP08_01740 [Candidatus Aenigmatarchaeota archaeon]|nr:MAG: hypothetical protein DRJ69_01580 [Thermoprotei archaeon]RLJ04440.1 MAG: hypothetical protein DRP08_01740 [Candidatus Aenigmarchaeota archaeon]
MDDEEGMGTAIFVVMLNIVFAIIFFFLVGSVMCGILPSLTNVVGIGETSPFGQALTVVPNLVNVFFYLPLIFIFTTFVWLFKYIVKRHKYTYYQQGGEEKE